MQKPSFGVITGVVTVLAAVALGAKLLLPLIPEPKRHVSWEDLSETAFREARNRDNPVLFVVSAPWSRLGRYMDQEVFTDSQIQQYLERNYVCVRVDADREPKWLNAFLPLSRVRVGLPPGFQCWVLDPQGHMYSYIGSTLPGRREDVQTVLAELIHARENYVELRTGSGSVATLIGLQQTDIETIEAFASPLLPDFQAAAKAMEAQVDPVAGGFPRHGNQLLYPNAWRYFLLNGDSELLQVSLEPALASSIVDLQDGGFFRMATRRNWTELTFDKLAVNNAEMAYMLALSGVLRSDHLHRVLAQRALDSLETEFMDGGLVQTARIGDEIESQWERSARSSYNPKEMRQLLPDEGDRDWARQFLGMRVESNRQMVPQVGDPAIFEDQRDTFERILGRLSERKTNRVFGGGFLMSVNGTVAARAYQVARLWAEDERLTWAERLFDRLDRDFRAANQVPHLLDASEAAPDYLGDYLAFSDAALQDYLATGRVVSLQSGLAVLRRALFLFEGRAAGEYFLGPASDSALMPQDTNVPEVVDTLSESCTAQVIRLCLYYGRLTLGMMDKSENVGLTLTRTAQAAATLLGSAASDLGVPAAGYDCAALEVKDDAYAIAVGPKAQALADELYRLRPTRMVAPAFGFVRSDLQSRAPGLYVVRQGHISGPLSVDAAAAALPLVLQG